MKENNTYQEEMEPNGLPESLRVNPFVIPENYFEKLGHVLMSQAKIDGLQHSASVFTTPENYFESLQQDLATHVRTEKLKKQVAQDGFVTAEHYFEDLKVCHWRGHYPQ